jgi:hypothetical protein
MKIGILTFHWADNYGAVLQAYALSNCIKSIATEDNIEIINYVSVDNVKIYYPFVFRSDKFSEICKEIIRGLKNYPRWFKKHLGYNAFRDKMPISKRYSREQLLSSENDYDIWITGSDQVWNTEIVGRDYEIYDLSFVKMKKKCSYAASSGEIDADSNEIQKKLLDDIEKLDLISVREKTTKEYLASKTMRPISWVIDPSLLIESTLWREMAGCNRIYKRKYLFVYYISIDPKIITLAKSISKMLGLDIVVCGYAKEFKGKAYQYKSASPKDFLNLIMNADFVLASSFHATAFSIIFEKQFIALVPPYASNRVVDLCEICGLENRIVTDNTDIASFVFKNICFDDARANVENERVKSIQYIKDILKVK